MGVKGTHDNTNVLYGHNFTLLVQLLRPRFAKHAHNNVVLKNRSANPTIDFDASWVAHKLSGTIIDHAEKIKCVAYLFVTSGIDVVILCDGEKRHHLKCASTM
jgi:hypothetical protein